jgi:hypothetical protein
VSTAPASAIGAAGLLRTERSASAAGAGAPSATPLVAVLCAESRARVAAAGIALALARTTGRRCALAGVAGAEAGAAVAGLPAARRESLALRRHGLPASASGRLVWLTDRRGSLQANDVPSRCAALSAELGRSAAALGLPAAVAFPCVRTDALDRVLAWHDAIVLGPEPDVPAAMIEQAIASLARLDRPVGVMMPPSRTAGLLAVVGLAAPAEAMAALAALSQTGFDPRRGHDA